MATLPSTAVDPIAEAVYRAYQKREAEQPPREHLGASLIGHHCDRFLWLTFRWAEREDFDGRMLRLFATGQLEEARFTADLRAIGCEVHDTAPDGGQWRVSDFGGHFGGSMDGCVHNVPGKGAAWAVVEYKTHSDKSFKALVKDGVKKAKPQHVAQMQTYMGYTGMERALYVAKNKNTDELHFEWPHFDGAEFKRLKERAGRIIAATEPPAKCSEDPSWYQCRTCVFREQCHGDQVPLVNCRTCANATPVLDGERKWTCALDAKARAIPVDVQKVGCSGHRIIPVLLARTARAVDYQNGSVIYEIQEGRRFANGENQGDLSSVEIRTCSGKAVLPDAAEVKRQVPSARVIA